MKKYFFLFLVFVMTVCACPVMAQQICMEQTDGSVAFYHDLNKAIPAARDGATIFLPAGGFGLNDSVKIDKRISLIGVGYHARNEGGATVINGDIQLEPGASGSVFMGLYVSRHIRTTSDKGVNNILVKFCNVDYFTFNSACQDLVMVQNVVRSGIDAGNSPCVVRNSIVGYIMGVDGGCIENNITFSYFNDRAISYSSNSVVVNNIILVRGFDVTEELSSHNMGEAGWDLGANTLSKAEGASWSDIFVDYQEGRAIHLNDWHLKDGVTGKNGGNDGTDVGIYGGLGFNTMGTPPYPHVLLKEVPDATDAQGNLKIKVKVVTP